MLFINSVRGMSILLTCLLAFACSDTIDTINDADPQNLVVDVMLADDGSGFLRIEAKADHATEYKFWIGQDTEPYQTNTTGVLEYTFSEGGDYRVEVRAYGVSGRYLREEFVVSVVIEEEEVDVEQGYVTPLSYDGYDLVWHDEFDGNTVNPDYWVFEIGDGCPDLCGWGNNEWQYYRNGNAWVSDGVLTIEARRENFGGSSFTSARMKTEGRKSFQYGRVDIRALLPKGQGIWPALWMLGNNITTVGWPRCGEIDIMEMIGGSGRENQVHGTLHWHNNGHVFTGGSYTLSEGTFADEYHVFTIIWDEEYIRWFVNDIQYYELLITPAHMTEFHQEFFFIFNVAVGGNWPGYPDQTTTFPQQMRVDYIRVFQKTES